MPTLVQTAQPSEGHADEEGVTSSTPSTPAERERALRDLLDLQQQASTRHSRLVQVCVIDHASPFVVEGQPHLHLQFLFSDHARTPWMYVESDLTMLNQTILSWASHTRPRISLRVHVHEEVPSNGGPAAANAVAALPRLTLTQCSAARLVEDGYDACPICLDSLDEGEEIVCMPCSGQHLSHTRCIEKWLSTASTCPSCRFMLPSKGATPTASELDALCADARGTLERIRRDEPPPCPPCDEEVDCDNSERDAAETRAESSRSTGSAVATGDAQASVHASAERERYDAFLDAWADDGEAPPSPRAPMRAHPPRTRVQSPSPPSLRASPTAAASSSARSRLFSLRSPLSAVRTQSRPRRQSSVTRMIGMGRCLFSSRHATNA